MLLHKSFKYFHGWFGFGQADTDLFLASSCPKFIAKYNQIGKVFGLFLNKTAKPLIMDIRFLTVIQS